MKIGFIFLFVFLSAFVNAQDIEYVKTIINDLCAEEMFGRGYVNAGDKKAAFYIENQFKEMDLIAFDTQLFESNNRKRRLPKYTQEFYLGVNTIPGQIMLGVGKRDVLKAGEDYLVGPASGTIAEKELDLFYLTKKHIKNEKAFDVFVNEDYTDKAVVIDMKTFEKEKDSEYLKNAMDNMQQAEALIIIPNGNLSSFVARRANSYPTFYVRKESFPDDTEYVRVKVESKYIRKYQSQNVIGMKKGKKYPDKYIVIGAHYDHLGKMGKNVYFPGANDNASGVAMMLDLAKYFSDPFNEPDYSIVFIGFGAEEAGLVGSRYFVDNPLIPLKNIEFMINLDMMSSGETGMMVVNATSNKKQWEQLNKINEQKQYITALQSRGPAANSDHHFFHDAGVPSFFFYLMGEEEKEYYYHHPKDLPSNLSLAGYKGAFKLITEFVEGF